MKYENRFGLHVGKRVGKYCILGILPKEIDLRVDCVVSDGNVWKFHISQGFPNLKIRRVKVLMHKRCKWKGRYIAYHTTRSRDTQKVVIEEV